VLLERPPCPGTVQDALYRGDAPWVSSDLDCSATASVAWGLPSSPLPHPWLEGLGLGWWEEVFFQPEEDPLLLMPEGAVSRRQPACLFAQAT
ncbi:unnamed protein product, partial [Discosporangium mesarthrocarpum]